jgi:N-acetylneuraminic acid mutarotase
MLHGITYRFAEEKLYLKKFWLILIFLALVSIQISAQNGWTKKTHPPTSRASASACVIDGKIFVIGGNTTSVWDIANNETYDPLTDTWEVKSSMPTPRSFLFTGVVNDTIYAIGGGYQTTTKKNEAYDPVTNSWTTKADMPYLWIGVYGAVINGKIYIIGGNYNMRNCFEYDPGTNTWTEKTPMPNDAGGALSATVYNGLIYTFGGSTYSPWAALSTVYAYNPLTDTWTKKASMPTPRFALRTFLVNGKIYAIGGSQHQNSALAAVEVYDPVNDTWDSLDDMPFNNSWFAGAVVNDKIYVIGGTPDWVSGLGDIWEYDPAYVVPVELKSLSASAQDRVVTLNWSTVTELNNYGFEIQRKILSGDFATIAFVKGQGTTTQQNKYSYEDKNLDEGKYFYRLKQMDYDGKHYYSAAVEVDVRMLNKFSLEQNYPNPFNPTTTIGFVLQEKGNVKLTLLNTLGEEIAVLLNEEQDKGYHKVELTAKNLSSGIYIYQLKSSNFIATKKLLLIK